MAPHNLPTAMWMSWAADSPPVEPSDETTALADGWIEARGPGYTTPRLLTHRNDGVVTHVHCFKLLNFGVICYTAFDDRYNLSCS